MGLECADAHDSSYGVQADKEYKDCAQHSYTINPSIQYLFPRSALALILSTAMDPQQNNDDPIIRSMADPPARIPFEPETSSAPPPKAPAADDSAPMPKAPDLLSSVSKPAPVSRPREEAPQPSMPAPKNLGNPPSIDAPKPAPKPRISYSPPDDARHRDRPADAPKEPSRPTPAMTTSSAPHMKPPETTAASPAAHESRAHGGSVAAITLSILSLLLLAIGLPLLWLKTNATSISATDATATVRQDIGALATKVENLNAMTSLIQDANATAKQDLFNAGSDVLKCADTTSKIADVILAEGNRLKAEGDAAKDQPKSQQGQWLIDRANELKQTATTCATSGTNAQTRSGIPVNK